MHSPSALFRATATLEQSAAAASSEDYRFARLIAVGGQRKAITSVVDSLLSYSCSNQNPLLESFQFVALLSFGKKVHLLMYLHVCAFADCKRIWIAPKNTFAVLTLRIGSACVWIITTVV